MNSLLYHPTTHSSNPATIKQRIDFYVENNLFDVALNEFSCVVVSSETNFSKQEIINIDSAMSSLGYLRI